MTQRCCREWGAMFAARTFKRGTPMRLAGVTAMSRPAGWLWVALLALTLASPVHAARERTLPLIDHSLPVREQYLPQLMSGPGSLAWSPDSQEIIYSMAGSLWRQ